MFSFHHVFLIIVEYHVGKKKKTNHLDILMDYFLELHQAPNNQRLLIIVTHGFIELLLNSIIDIKCKNGKNVITQNNRDFPLSVKLVILHELNILDDRLYEILDWFRKVRNRAAHEPFFNLKTSDINYANSVLDRFIPNETLYKPDDFFHFCALLVGTIWNENLTLMNQVFGLDNNEF